jgi:hypothetical protein
MRGDMERGGSDVDLVSLSSGDLLLLEVLGRLQLWLKL